MSNHTSLLHRRLLAAGLIAGLTSVALAGTAQAAETVSTGQREPVTTAVVSPSALPATVEASGTARTSRTTQVTITL